MTTTSTEARVQALMAKFEDLAVEAGKSAIAIFENIDGGSPEAMSLKQGYNRAFTALESALRSELAGKDAERLTQAERDVLAERQSQRIKWGDAHDDEHHWGIADAAICYVQGYMNWAPGRDNTQRWPWEHAAWKPRSRRENLVRATAMLIAELDRVDRAAIESAKKETT
jgi:hypothetical protein